MSYNPYTYWKRKASVYHTAHIKEEDENCVELVREHLPHSPKILDVGAALGITYQLLQDSGIDVLNYEMVDFVDEFRNRCQEETGILPDKWDGKTLPYEDNAFDMVISWSVMLHVESPDIKAFIKEHARVSNGFLFIATWYEIDGRQQSGCHCYQHDYPEVFKQLGLEIVEERPTNYRGKQGEGRYRRMNWLLKKT